MIIFVCFFWEFLALIPFYQRFLHAQYGRFGGKKHTRVWKITPHIKKGIVVLEGMLLSDLKFKSKDFL